MEISNLKKYLQSVLEMELNAYTQQQVINKVSMLIPNIEKKKEYASLPHERKTAGPVGFIVGSGVFSWLVYGIINAVSEYNRYDVGFIGKIFTFLGSIIVGAINGFIFGLLAAVPVGLVVWLIYKPIAIRHNKKQYEREYKEYLRITAAKNAKNSDINNQVKSLYNQIDYVNTGLKATKANLAKAYSFGVLAPDYRNIYAVSAILSYLEKGRTKSLKFNERTGDRGAYNIYEEERRLDKIITNTEEILYRLDDLVREHNKLAEGLAKSNAQVSSMLNSIKGHIAKTSNALNNIQASQSVIAYNTQKAASELSFMNWMRALGY